jgi:hypothetical protein
MRRPLDAHFVSRLDEAKTAKTKRIFRLAKQNVSHPGP